MVSTKEDGTGIERVGRLGEAGYDYVELALAELMVLSEVERQELLEMVKSSGVPCETCNNLFPKTVRLTGPGVDLEKVVAYVEEALALAREIGAKTVVFGSGPAKNVPEGFPHEEGYQQVIELLRRMGDVAGRNGITIVIEPLRKAECNLINTFEEGVRLAKDVDHDNVKVLIDYYHMTVEKEPADILLQDGEKYLGHVHFANPEGRVYPEDMGESDYRSFIEALRGIGYTGRISCEAYTQDFDRHCVTALDFFRTNFS
jgi:sugar phosphate isomerase/epimerase